MKVWLLLISGVFIFSGCSTKTQNYRLRTINAKQAALIQKQQTQINLLRSKLNMRQIERQKKSAEILRSQRYNSQQTPAKNRLPEPPKKNIKLKKVEDNNYSSSYMYPGASKKKSVIKKPDNNISTNTNIPKPISSTMTKEECISMIGEEKFTKYTTMFGSESASLKRCKMLKAMKQ